jgi:hypothetical protein
LGWGPLIETDSGGGYGLIYPIDLPTDRAANNTIKNLLRSLRDQFPFVDPSVSNCGTLTRLIGTLNIKNGAVRESRILNDYARTTGI